MKKVTLIIMLVALVSQAALSQDRFIEILKTELNRNFTVLKDNPVPAYYVSYRVQDMQTHNISASFGKLLYNSNPRHQRLFNVDVRVGDYEMDNTREIKGGNMSNNYSNNDLVLEDNPAAIQKALWRNTDQVYKDAVKQFENVKANVAVKVAAEDKSGDFTKESPEKYFEPPVPLKNFKFDAAEWEHKLKKYTEIFSDNKDVLNNMANIEFGLVRKYFVDTEGREVAENACAYRLHISISTVAEDGMSLPLFLSYFAIDAKDLPSDARILKDAKDMSEMISILRKAPVAEAYSGPALMTAEAAGVFFHEIFGHRVEGARLKQESDAQTFKKKVGESVLPKDISIVFDPKLKKYRNMPLNGSYVFDDEGIRGQRVEVVRDGILKSFLMSRTPIENFSNSNGHGRAVIYADNVTRQSNMIIESNDPKSIAELRAMALEQAKKENREYVYLFDKVSGGFTTTGRYMPNAFNVTPLIVYRIYADGRPDELVRGVDLLGTPLAIFSQVTACGQDHGVFNGACGAESGSIPVSCVSPTLYIKMIETQKKSKSQNQPPILERP
ncbi:MAG: TldD/PmbA family protein [Prevotellaceae bacterium]|jgi:predicted Zn-dependent protease|nr:TldD/PmbA family protein [Prevotellaceae bacterium]